MAREDSKGDIQSLWSIVRKSFQRLDLSVDISADQQIHLNLPEGTVSPSMCKLVTKAIRKEAQSSQLDKLLACPNQGRSFSVTSKSPASNHWVGTGHHISFAAYWFATKARSNLLPVQTVLKHTRRTENITCPKCHNSPESLGHVLNACTPNVPMMRERHNTILDQVKKATSKHIGTLFVDQAIPEAPGILHPDLMAKTDTTITIVDVTMPYELGLDAFNSTRAKKTQKYSELVQWAKTKYSHVHFGVLVVGNLGSWDTDSEETLKMLGIGQKYARLFRKLCCVDAINGSIKIWRARSSTP